MTENYAEGGPLAVFYEPVRRRRRWCVRSPPATSCRRTVFEGALADIANGADVADALDAAVDEIETDIEANSGYGH
jgi:multiple sugar transport system substrate-binding protein